MVTAKIFFSFLLLVSFVGGSQREFDRRVLALLRNQESESEASQETHQARRYEKFQADHNDDDDEINTNRRSHANDVEEDEEEEEQNEYFQSRAPVAKGTNTVIVITLQNRAAMTTRLRVLYTDAAGTPYFVERSPLLTAQDKSVTIPSNAQHIQIIVDKLVFIGVWRNAYSATLPNNSTCLLITGATFSSTVKPCK